MKRLIYFVLVVLMFPCFKIFSNDYQEKIEEKNFTFSKENVIENEVAIVDGKVSEDKTYKTDNYTIYLGSDGTFDYKRYDQNGHLCHGSMKGKYTYDEIERIIEVDIFYFFTTDIVPPLYLESHSYIRFIATTMLFDSHIVITGFNERGKNGLYLKYGNNQEDGTYEYKSMWKEVTRDPSTGVFYLTTNVKFFRFFDNTNASDILIEETKEQIIIDDNMNQIFTPLAGEETIAFGGYLNIDRENEDYQFHKYYNARTLLWKIPSTTRYFNPNTYEWDKWPSAPPPTEEIFREDKLIYLNDNYLIQYDFTE